MIKVKYETCKNGFYETGFIEYTEQQYQQLLNELKEGDKGKMSVPAYNRKLSTIEFITKADDLIKCTITNLKKVPKTYTFFGKVETFQDVRKATKCLIRANDLDLMKYYDERTKLFNEALGWLACVSDDINLLKTMGIKLDDNGKKNDNKWIRWGNLITMVEKLVKGVIAKDKERFNKKE